MKGVLICGGSGSRLKPLTDITNKSLLPVYDKPLILYPLEVLLRASITEIAIVTGNEHMDQMAKFLGDGKAFGCTFHYIKQDQPRGIAHALSLTEEFSQGESVCAILGDNVFFDDLSTIIKNFTTGAHLFLKAVHDPERFGVATIKENRIESIEEKPAKPQTNLAVTGCYLYDARCFDFIRTMKPSSRGELEITDVSRFFVEQGQAIGTMLEQEWIDAGTFESLFRAAEIVRSKKL